MYADAEIKLWLSGRRGSTAQPDGHVRDSNRRVSAHLDRARCRLTIRQRRQPGRKLDVKTARSWRGIVAFTHLAREGRMTVTIGRRELLAALGGAVVWPLAARGQQPAMPVIGFLSTSSQRVDDVLRLAPFRRGLLR